MPWNPRSVVRASLEPYLPWFKHRSIRDFEPLIIRRAVKRSPIRSGEAFGLDELAGKRPPLRFK